MPVNDEPSWTEIGIISFLASVTCSTGPAIVANWLGSSVLETIFCNSLHPSLYITYRGLGAKLGFFSQRKPKITSKPPPLKPPTLKEAKELLLFTEMMGINSKLFLNLITSKETTAGLESIILNTGLGLPITIVMIMLASYLTGCMNRTHVQPQESKPASLRLG